MPTGHHSAADALAATDDPRLAPEFWRALPPERSREPVLLVGVVHGHPASSYRVRAAAGAFDPDVVGLELPSVAVPAFERVVAARTNDDAAEVGEMCAAIAAAPDTRVVGIDTLGSRFVGRLAANAVAGPVSASTVRRTAGNVAHVLRDALAHRVGRGNASELTGTTDGDATPADAPAVQAADERRQVSRCQSLLGAIERPRADRLLDETREGNMATRVDDLGRNGSVLAVVGMDHLDAIASRLS